MKANCYNCKYAYSNGSTLDCKNPTAIFRNAMYYVRNGGSPRMTIECDGFENQRTKRNKE